MFNPQRDRLVTEAKWWERATFAHHQWLKGATPEESFADCSTFVAGCFRAVGIFMADVPSLPSDWFLHTKKEWYLEELQKHTLQYAVTETGLEQLRQDAEQDGRHYFPTVHAPQPGDIVIVKDTAIGAKVFSHGCIVVEWPIVIHCFPPCVMRSNIHTYPAFSGRKLKFFDPFAVTTDVKG